MSYSVGIVGPARLLSVIYRTFVPKTSIWPQIEIVGMAYTDKPPNTGLPSYASWSELLKQHALNVVINLSDDKQVIKGLRSELPEHIRLMEDVPAHWMNALFRAHEVLHRKQDHKSRFLNQTLDSLPFAAILFNSRGHVIHWNKHCEALTEIPAEQIIGQNELGHAFYLEQRPLLGQIILKQDRVDKISAAFGQSETDFTLLENGVQVSGYLHLRGRLTGYYLITAQRIVKDGKVLGSLELIQDMSAVSLLKTQLEEHQDTLQLIMSNLPFPLLSTDLQGHINFHNAAAQNYFLTPLNKDENKKDNNIFSHLNEAIGKDDTRGLLGWLNEKQFESSPSRVINVTIQDKSWEITCIKTGETHSDNALWILRNISEKESEDRLSTALAFSGAISHELAQPLTAVSNSAYLLSRTDPADKKRIKKHNAILEKESERIMAVYRKLRNLNSYKLQGYLDTQIMDLDDSSDDLFPLENSGEK